MHSDQAAEDLQTGRQVWPGRYSVRAEVNYRDRKGKTSVMHVITYQPEMSREEVDRLLADLGYTPSMPGYSQLASQVRDTFSADQADKLVRYMNRQRGTRAFMRPANKPMPNVMGASTIKSLPSFRDSSIYKLYTNPRYDLDFKVETVNMKTLIALGHLFQEFHEQEKVD